MTATLVEVMQGIETRLETITGLRATDFTADQINPPHAMVAINDVDYRLTMGRGKYQINFEIAVFTSAALDRTGQRALLAYANPRGSSSVIVAFEADKTLGGIVDHCVIDTFAPMGLQKVGEVDYYGGRFKGRVVLTGT